MTLPDAQSSSAEQDERRERLPAEPALWGVLLGDVLVFTGLFVLYLLDGADAPQLYAEAQAVLNTDLAAANTLVLLTSSLLVVVSAQRFRAGQLASVPGLLRWAALLGVLFIGIKCVEYTSLIDDGHTPEDSTFFMWYFVLTGLHLAHVVIGLLLLAIMHWLARDPAGANQGRLIIFEAGASFWHMVDLLWIIIFPLLFLVR